MTAQDQLRERMAQLIADFGIADTLQAAGECARESGEYRALDTHGHGHLRELSGRIFDAAGRVIMAADSIRRRFVEFGKYEREFFPAATR